MTRLRGSFHRKGTSGFSAVELLVGLAILGLIAMLGFPSLHRMIIRSKLEAVAQETSVFLRQARLDSIRQSIPVVVQVDPESGQAVAFVDRHDAAGEPVPDLELTPAPGMPPQATDYVVLRFRLPSHVAFGGPESDPEGVVGFTDRGAGPRIVFNSDGSVTDPGALRFGDSRGNVLEVRIEPAATAGITVRKWHRDAQSWYPRGTRGTDDGGGSTWEWYG